jgi:hypothetical protein
MKLISFDATNMVTQRKGDACISFSRASANAISKAAVERLEYAAGDKIGIHQDEDNPDDWYMSLAEEGFELRSSKDTGSLAFNNVALSNMLLDNLEIDEPRASFFIAGEPTVIDDVNYWAILTSKPIIKKRRKVKK